MKIYTLPNGQKLEGAKQFRIKDQVYPVGWLDTASDEELSAIGIVYEIVTPPPQEPPVPVEPEPAPPRTIVGGLEFLKRLTDDEYGLIMRTALAALLANPSQPRLHKWMDMVRVNSAIDVAGEEATEARSFLVAAKLLTEERAAEIFALPE